MTTVTPALILQLIRSYEAGPDEGLFNIKELAEHIAGNLNMILEANDDASNRTPTEP